MRSPSTSPTLTAVSVPPSLDRAIQGRGEAIDCEPLHINGNIEGLIDASGRVMVSRDALAWANIPARRVMIPGGDAAISGDLTLAWITAKGILADAASAFAQQLSPPQRQNESKREPSSVK